MSLPLADLTFRPNSSTFPISVNLMMTMISPVLLSSTFCNCEICICVLPNNLNNILLSQVYRFKDNLYLTSSGTNSTALWECDYSRMVTVVPPMTFAFLSAYRPRNLCSVFIEGGEVVIFTVEHHLL